jgi:hypothetical protein
LILFEFPLPLTKPIVSKFTPSILFSTSNPLLLVSLAVLQFNSVWLFLISTIKLVSLTGKGAFVEAITNEVVVPFNGLTVLVVPQVPFVDFDPLI